ncbi:Broad specificity phosphatase PhoE [Microbulbifer donghaiensis]|uniref:Broad specificity phosphatase PhoE n=1 Tax=Microbulbifer donghaiensis TaxID=494016 RepID=A0A1M5G7Z4_9GAMM|nr:histidine phosphatase family protein [Microbulbifer donghaiensis]SHF99794.1 Broad specificity phosphatase PhoE [Microbulbifer donghaiensis]
MTRILLVRHGEATKGPSIADPELTDLGRQQAGELARTLAPSRPLTLTSSPKTRARQTAQPLADIWQCPVNIESAVTELPSPEDVPLSKRGQWIRALLASDWDTQDERQLRWRMGILNYLLGLEEDTVIFCHFMVINSIVAHIRNDRRTQQFRPDYTSVTELQLTGGGLELIRLGAERDSRIL